MFVGFYQVVMGLMEQNGVVEKMNVRKRQEKINSQLVLGDDL